MQLCNMAKIEKVEVEFHHLPPCGKGNLHKVAAPYFLLFMYMVQLYKEDWGILHKLGCWAIALPSTEQIVGLVRDIKTLGAVARAKGKTFHC